MTHGHGQWREDQLWERGVGWVEGGQRENNWDNCNIINNKKVEKRVKEKEFLYTRGDHPKITGIAFWRAGTLQYGLPPPGECPRKPSVPVPSRQFCERKRSSSVSLFKTLSMCSPISWFVIDKHTCPHSTEGSAVFDQKWHDQCAPHSLLIWSCP